MPTIYKTRKLTGKEKGITLRFSQEVHEKLEDLCHCLRKPKVEVMELLIRDATKDLPPHPKLPQLERFTGGGA